MRIYLLISIFLSFAVVNCLFATDIKSSLDIEPFFDIDKSFTIANSLYQDGNYSEAAKAYLNLLKHQKDTAIMFNLGNSWFKYWQSQDGNISQSCLGKAILCYEKVLWADPLNQDAKANLAYAKTFIRDKFDDDDHENQVMKHIVTIWSFPSVYQLEVLTILLIWFLLFLISVRRKIRNNLFSEFSFWLLFLLIPLTIVFGIWVTSRAVQYEGQNEAIILVDSLDIKGAPSLDGTVVFSLHEGAKVFVVRQSSGWVQISLPNGLSSGWVREEKLGFIQRK